MKKTVIVHGPQGCGKTFHSDNLARFFRVDRIVDEFNWTDPIPLLNCLALTNEPPPALLADDLRVLSFDQAMTLAGLKRSGVPS